MNKYLKFSIAAATLSLAISLYLFMQIRLEINSLFGLPTSITLDKIEKTSELSTAVSAIFGLIIGSIAIIALIESERSETKALEALKVDLISLVNVLQMLKNRCLLYSSPHKISFATDIFQKEKEYIQNFLGSSSGYALSLWMGKDHGSDNFDINSSLSELINYMTLKFEKNPRPIFLKIASHCYQIIEKLTKIDDKDFNEISKTINKIGTGLDHLSELNAKTFSDQIKNMIANDDVVSKKLNEEKFNMPSQYLINKVLNNTKVRIGVELEKILQEILDEAKRGDNKSLWYFYEIVRQLNLDKRAGFSTDIGGQIIPRASNFTCIPIGNGKIKMYSLNFSTNNFEFASSRYLAEISSLLNLLAYKNSIWETNIEDKINRNYLHVLRNPKTILLIKYNEEFIGFTHCIPVDDSTWTKYLKGEISDSDFSDMKIINNEDYSGLIIFSIGYLGSLSDKTKLDLAYKAIVYHIYTFLSNKESLNLVIQNSDPYLLKVLSELEFRQHENLSMDGYKIFTAKVINEIKHEKTN